MSAPGWSANGSAVPDAPWALVGDAVIAVVGGSRRGGRSGSNAGLPKGVRRLPGPAIVAAVRYTESPVGPFLELAVAEPARLGLRPGLCFTTSVVSASSARVGGRIGWGFPRELGRLQWSNDDGTMGLWWDDRDVSLLTEAAGGRGRPRAAPGWLPVFLPVRGLQRRSDGPVVVHGHVRGRLRFGRVTIAAPEDDPLGWLAGTHRGVVIAAGRFLLRPARRPTGLFSTLRAPLRAAEPALSGGPAGEGAVAYGRGGRPRRYSAASPRALSSVG